LLHIFKVWINFEPNASEMKTFQLISVCFALLWQTDLFAQPIVISGGPENDIIGRICRHEPDQMIAIIERNPDWLSGDLYTSKSWDNGFSWDELIPVVTKPGNQSTHSVVVTQDDSIRVYYASDETGSYKIFTISSSDGNTWVNDHQLNLGWEPNQGIYDPHVIVDQDGSMTMTYVKFGGGGYVAHCSEINVWDQNKTLVQAVAYRIRICPYSSGGYLAAYHRNMGGNQYEVNVKTSQDLINWSDEVQLTNSGNSHDPFCGCTDIEHYWVYYAAYKNGAYNLYRKSSVDGLNWSEEEQITFDNSNNTQPAFFIDLYTKTIALNLVWTHAINYETDNDIYFERYIMTESSEYFKPENNFEVIQISDQSFLLKVSPGLTGRAEISIYNISGKLVERKVSHSGTGSFQVDLELNIGGVYLFSIDIAGKRLTSKIVVN
jgi:hypothetical protein